MNKIFRNAIVLALAGTALLYTGCTKDYSQEITDLQEKYTNLENSTSERIAGLNKQLATLTSAVSSLETAKAKAEEDINTLKGQVSTLQSQMATAQGDISALKTAVASAQANITSLQTAVNGLNSAIATANAQIAALEAAVTNTYDKETVDGKLAELKDWANLTFATKEAVAEIATSLGTLKGTVEAIDAKLTTTTATADEALAKANTALGDIETIKAKFNDYYTKAEIDAKVATLTESIAATDAKVTALEEAFNEFKEEANGKFEALDNKLNEEIAARVALAAVVDANTAAIKVVTDTTVQIRAQLNQALIDIAENAQAIEDEVAAREALQDFVNGLETRIATLEDETQKLREDVDTLIDDLDELAHGVAAISNRIQSVVFVPTYTDFAADAYEYKLPTGRIQTKVVGLFEVKPNEAIWRLDDMVEEGQVQLAVRQLDSRAEYDVIISDVNVDILTEGPDGRFVVSAFIGPEFGVSEADDAPFAISLILGNFAGDETYVQDPNTGVMELEEQYMADNHIQSAYVPVVAASQDQQRYIFDLGYTWFDEKTGAVSELGESDYPNTDLSRSIRIPYTEPADNLPIYSEVVNGEDIYGGLCIYVNDGTEEGEFKSIADFAKEICVNADDITPTVLAENHTFNANDEEQDTVEPFDYAGGIAPETTVTTTAPEGKELKDFVKFYGTHFEWFGFEDPEDPDNFFAIELTAYAKTTITKNQVPAFDSREFEIPWSYQHPQFVENKEIPITAEDGDLYAAVQGVWDDTDVTFEPAKQDGETVEFEGTSIIFNGWAFGAEDASYKASDERFETESDEYTVAVPFVIKKVADDRDVAIDLGEVAYTPTFGYTDNISVIAEGFQAHETEKEEYFIGDAEVPVNDGDDEAQAQLDSLYNQFAHAEAENFQITSAKVNGVELTADELDAFGVTINFAYNLEEHEDVSTILVEPATVGYGKTVEVTGTWTAWGVAFNYTITFKTPEVPFFLVLTPYKDFDPSKSNTIIVEGDDVTDPALYTLEQMYYTKYMRVQDQEGVPTNGGENLEVRFAFEYEDFDQFGLEELAEVDEEAAKVARGTVDGVTDAVEVLGGVDAGYLDKQAILTWGSYEGLLVKATATLYDNGIAVSEPLEFNIETMQPVKLIQAGTIGTEAEPLIRVSGNELQVNVAADMVIAGVLSRNAETNEAWYIDPDMYGVFDYKYNNINQENGEVCEFYGLEVEYDWDNITAKLNNVDWTLHEGTDFTAQGNVFTLIADNAKGSIEIKVPVRILYYLDYCGAKAMDAGVVTINVKQI